MFLRKKNRRNGDGFEAIHTGPLVNEQFDPGRYSRGLEDEWNHEKNGDFQGPSVDLPEGISYQLSCTFSFLFSIF